MTTENVDENSSDSITAEDTPTDTTKGSKDKQIVEKKRQRNLVDILAN